MVFTSIILKVIHLLNERERAKGLKSELSGGHTLDTLWDGVQLLLTSKSKHISLSCLVVFCLKEEDNYIIRNTKRGMRAMTWVEILLFLLLLLRFDVFAHTHIKFTSIDRIFRLFTRECHLKTYMLSTASVNKEPSNTQHTRYCFSQTKQNKTLSWSTVTTHLHAFIILNLLFI